MNGLSTVEFVLQLDRLKVKLSADGDRLRCSAPPGVITPDLQNELAARKTEILKFLKEASLATRRQPPAIAHIPRDGELPLSFAQMRLWLINQMEPGSVTYNIPALFRFEGNFNLTAFEQSLSEIVRRHEVLRTYYLSVSGRPVQKIAPPEPFKISVIDLQALGETERQKEAARLASVDARQPFDLGQAPLMRATLLKLAPEEQVLLINVYHIAFDGWSFGVFAQELSVLYKAFLSGQASPLPELPVQYVDFAAWQRQWLQGEVLQTQLDYWKERLSGSLPVLELPTDRPRPAVQTYNGGNVSFAFSKRLTDALKSLSQREDVTLFVTLLAAFQVLLLRYTGQEDLLVGTPIANRNRAEIEELIGFFVNTLVMRSDLSGNPSFRELLGRVQETALGAYAHQDLPFEKLVEELNPERNFSRSPIFQVMFSLLNTPMQSLELPGLEPSRMKADGGTSKFDLTLYAVEIPEGLSCTFEYSTDLFNADRIERMVGHFETLLGGIVENPEQRISQLPLLREAERRQLQLEWNSTQRDYPQMCIHELFEAQAKRVPGAVAVVFKDLHLTYDELNSRSNRLADYLRSLGVDPDMPVGICAERSLEMIVGILGILKAGGAYVPLDPAYPMERLSFMIRDAGVTILLTQDRFSSRVPRHLAQVVSLDQIDKLAPTNEPRASRNPPKPDNLAYVMYTSGSTGKPKGVEITHRGVVRLLFGANYVSFGDTEVFLQLAPLSFDASTFEIWGALLHGGRVVIYPAAVPTTHELRTVLLGNEVSTLFLTTSLFNVVIDEAPGVFSSVRQLLFGGESVSVKHVRRALELLPGTQLIHCYGPTECTTFATCFHILKDLSRNVSSIPIGRPIANTSAYILDLHHQLVPMGIPGELHLGGDGLARGYLKRPELTGEKFIPNPFTNEQTDRLYATGDLARLMPDGNIEFLGRLDDQVKIHGFRIEPGEIESVLASHPRVKQSAVIAREDKSGDRRLYAYVVQRADQSITVSDLQEFLRQRMPSYMMPSEFITLEALPLTPNGKVDRKALPAPQPGPDAGYLRPRSPLEFQIAEIWEELLGVRPIGVRSDFFELGGHSLLAVRMMNQIKEVFGVELPLASLFAGATIEHLAQRLLEAERDKFKSPLVEVQGGGSRQPFFFLHGDFNGGGFYCRKLARFLGSEQPFYVILPHGFGDEPIPRTIEAMAADRLQTLLKFRPHGPYLLGGHCNGALIAFEMARQMEQRGLRADLVVIVDGSAMNVRVAWLRSLIGLLGFCFRKDRNAQDDLFIHARTFLFRLEASWRQGKLACLRFLWNKKKRITEILIATLPGSPAIAHQLEREPQESEKEYTYRYVVRGYIPKSYKGRVVFLRTRAMLQEFPSDPTAGWRRVASDLKVLDVPGNHLTCLTVHAKSLAEALSSCLQAAAPAHGGDPPMQEESRLAAT